MSASDDGRNPVSVPYQGSELELFAVARNWKAYFASALRPYIRGRILEVGAGIGSNIGSLMTTEVREWTCLEPDQSLADQICNAVASRRLPEFCRVRVGTIEALNPDEKFDAILYIDVLEHIKDDHDELLRASGYLSENGFLVVVSPAHQFLYSPFDAAIGHYRRYSARQLRAAAPNDLRVVRSWMLDSFGFAASLGNRLVLRKSMPSLTQIAFWDNYLVPLSRFTDPILLHLFGKTVVVVWARKNT